jgi:exopolyphosphatase/guanosine-5'-triphosphate,3'-diphosphate pyrophosphatase
MTDTYQHVLDLAYRYNPEDVEHMEQDAYLATTIFRLTRELHELPQECEELLEYAALLHDIGYFYGYDAHHKHAYRMIVAADIPGLDEREKTIVALTARYHRSAQPKPTHPGFRDLSQEDQETVTMLGAILRLADGLDRSHTNAVQDLECEVVGSHVIFTLHPQRGNEIERWAGLKKSRFFQEVFDVTVEIR